MIDKKNLRSRLFRHLDGLAMAPIMVALHDHKVLDYIGSQHKVTLEELTQKFSVNEGYLNVGLRALCSQGFLEHEINNQTDQISFATTPKSSFAFALAPLYNDVVALLHYSGGLQTKVYEEKMFEQLNLLFEKYKNNYGISFSTNPIEKEVQEQILFHIEGYLVGPIIVRLGMTGMFHKYFMETSFRPEEFHKQPETFKKILDFLTHLDWFTQNNGNYQFTETGLFFATRASAYGVTVSYLPTFNRIEDLIFGKASTLRDIAFGEDEIHVDREMNVWGSGGAHTAYFKVLDEIIIEIFNRPIEEQPKGVLDMGAGNGAFLQHIFEVIDRQTLRGKILDEHPLFLVGADYNQAALKVIRANLVKSDIWAKVIWGDIGRPDLLAEDLKRDYSIELSDLLNTRTFLDHNRIWATPTATTTNRISTSTGAFAHRGARISNNAVEDNLVEHLNKWAPYVQKHGLLIIELHTIAPHLAAKNIGHTAATAYDATHGFSDQYIVEIDVFHKICKEVGLYPNEKEFRKFPNSDIATVSINLLKGL
jgi:hypothetical protein